MSDLKMLKNILQGIFISLQHKMLYMYLFIGEQGTEICEKDYGTCMTSHRLSAKI